MTRAGSTLNVLLTADAAGGVWSYATELVKTCTPAGVRFVVALLGEPADASGLRELAAHGATIRHVPGRLEWMESPWTDVDRATAALERIAADERVDVVHLNGFAYAAGRFGRPTLTVAHSCVCSWWRAVHGGAAPREWNEYRRRVRAGLANSSVVVAPTHAMLHALAREHEFATATFVVSNGIAAGEPHEEKAPFVFAAGRLWDEAKNLRALDDVAGEVPWSVLIAGRADDPSGAVRHPVSARWLGPLDRQSTRGWMSRAAIYAWPAKYEPFGLSVLEAASAGCALVLGDIPTLRELWSGAAVFVDPDDRAELREALQRLTANDSERLELARKARSRAARYTATRMRDGYLTLYRALGHHHIADVPVRAARR